MSQQTEYFLALDLCYILTETKKVRGLSTVDEFTNFFRAMVNLRKEATFPFAMRPSNMSEDTAPDWTKEIGGLRAAKETIEDMFGITQQFSCFFNKNSHRLS